MKEFFRTYLAVILGMCTVLIPMAKADPPAGNGGPGVNFSSPNSTMAIGGTSFNPTLDIAGTITPAETFNGAVTLGSTLAANGVATFSNQLSFQSSAQTTCPGAGTPIANEAAPMCIGPTAGTAGLVMGKVTGNWGGTTSSNSSAINWVRNNGTTDSTCAQLYSAGGSMSFGCTISSNSNNITAGSAILQGNAFVTNAAGASGGTCTAAANTCTVTLGHTFSAGLCHGNDNTTAAPVKASLSGTTLTLTNASPGGATDSLSGFCFGNGGS